MARSNFGRVFEAKVLEVLDNRRHSMASGACKSYEHYQKEVGFCEGLVHALGIVDEMEREPDERDTSA